MPFILGSESMKVITIGIARGTSAVIYNRILFRMTAMPVQNKDGSGGRVAGFVNAKEGVYNTLRVAKF